MYARKSTITFAPQDWERIKKSLPTAKHDPGCIQARARLFKGFDLNGNGLLSYSEVERGVRDVIRYRALSEAKKVIFRAYMFACKSAKRRAGKKGKDDDDYITRSEFRIFLVALR